MQFCAGYMVIKVLSSKTDQLRQGDEVVVVRSGSATCPVVCLEQYCKLAGIDSGSTERLFRAISHTRNGESLGIQALSVTPGLGNFFWTNSSPLDTSEVCLVPIVLEQ